MILKLLRVIKIGRVAFRYGLDHIVMSELGPPRMARLAERLLFWRDISAPRGQRLRRALEELGPIFVKFGQVLSTRRDLLPPDIADELARQLARHLGVRLAGDAHDAPAIVGPAGAREQ